jgi:hypothetical protein
MMHMLYSPECFDGEDDTSILDLLPKRTLGELQVASDPVDGWGIYFEDERDVALIVGVSFGICLVASLLFLILWSVLKDDIQGGSGVGAYILAAGTSTLAIWLAVRG